MSEIALGSPTTEINLQQAAHALDELVATWDRPRRVLLIPPDFTRRHSWAGELTVLLYQKLCESAAVQVLPALGTHAPMSPQQLATMFPGIPDDAFAVHRWRDGLVRLAEVPAEFVREITAGQVNFAVPCEVNRLLVEGNWDHIVSIGQVVPHEVAGMANHSKNVFVGTGGAETINKTHYIGAVCDMEQAMGRTDTPVRRILRYMSTHCAPHLPLCYVLTVRGRNAAGQLVTRGLFTGQDARCFEQAADLCRQVNLNLLDEPLDRVVVYLDPDEYHSTWLGNKAIYRTRMAIADRGELIVIAPGVRTFGEDPEIDRLIRKYGYRGTPATLAAVEQNADLAANLSAAAHLIHGSAEDRFKITYAAGGLSPEEIDSVGFSSMQLAEAEQRYQTGRLRDGTNTLPDGPCFFVSNPGLGLWALRSRFEES